MSDLLLNWLNDEIQLCRRINNFEEDFHNGFLFGQLLAKYSQQLNFHEFVDKDDKASRIKNFSLLFETFAALKVTYDSNIAMKIISKQLGVAKKLLYELKTQLEKTNANSFNRTNRLNKTLSPLKKIQISKEKFDQANKDHFVKQLNELHPAQKEIIHDRLLKKFGDFHVTSLIKAGKDEEKEKQGNLVMRDRFIQQQRENLKKSEQFRKQWEEQHLQKWAVNMNIRQTQVAKDDQFKSKIQFERTQNKTMSQLTAIKSLDNDIAQFQKRNLKKNQDDSDEEPIKQTTKIIEKTEPQLRVREERREEKRIGANQTEKQKHQRQKRRRKMIVQQQKRYQLIEINRRERLIINTIQQTSKQQKEIQYQIWRAWQNKSIIQQNKKLYSEKIKEKQEVRTINAKFKRDELLKVYRDQHKQEIQAALHSHTLLHRNFQIGGRKQTYQACQEMIHQLLQITEDMYVSCQQRNKSEINQKQLESALIKFVQGTTNNDQENALRLKHYINGLHEWGFPINRPQEDVPSDPKEDNALPNQTINNYYLGNILHHIFQKLYSENQQNTVKPASDKLLLSIIGLEYSRKHYVADKTKEIYKINVINVDQLIQSKLKDYVQLKANGVQISKATEELAQNCFLGKPVSDPIIINLIKQQIDKYPQSILIDYPNTYDQAIQLCKTLANVEPHDMLSVSKLNKKIKEYERLVRSSQSKVVERKVRQCGIDFVWWIDITIQNSLDRMLGRRWIDNKEVHINDDIQPEKLKEGEKASALVMNNHFKQKHKNKLNEWFQLFGSYYGSENVILQKCWEQIDGNCEKAKLQSEILQKVKNVLTFKQNKTKWNIAQQQEQRKKQIKQQQQLKASQELKLKCVKSNPQNIKTQMEKALSKVDLERQFLEQTAQLWNKIQTSTVNSLCKAFQGLQQQQLNKKTHLAKVKKSFISLLTRQDYKFYLIKEFQNNYNKFLTQNQDMLAYEYTKEELHQRVEDLENDLLTIIEQKKEDAIAERNGVMTSGWLESQMEIISECLFVLVQTELNKFAASQKLINDYYGKRFMANTKTFEPLNPQLNSQNINALQIFKDGNCSRLDKLITEALRILNREEEIVDDKNKKGGKGAPPPKKDDKKAAKKGGKDEVEEVKQPTAEEIELKKAINTQKAILRQRLNRIKSLGSSKLKMTYENGQKLYSQLEDLYLYTDKVERKAILGLTKIFRRAIESEQKIENQVQIHHVQVTQTEKIRNFDKQKPIILPAREPITDKHFTLSNLHEIFKLIKNQAEGQKISTKRLIILLKRIISNVQLKKLLPNTWKTLKNSQIDSFVQLLDHEHKAYVDLSKIFMFILMSGFTLATPAQLQQYTLDLTNFRSLKETTLDKFSTTHAWFDESIEWKQNMRPFLRNDFVKEMLFNLFKKEPDDHMDIASYLTAIHLQQFFPYKSTENIQTYFDFAFN